MFYNCERVIVEKEDTMKKNKILEKIKQYLNDNKNSGSLDIQEDSKHLLFWIENWEAQNEKN